MNTQYLPDTWPLADADPGVCGVGSQRKDAKARRREGAKTGSGLPAW